MDKLAEEEILEAELKLAGGPAILVQSQCRFNNICGMPVLCQDPALMLHALAG